MEKKKKNLYGKKKKESLWQKNELHSKNPLELRPGTPSLMGSSPGLELQLCPPSPERNFHSQTFISSLSSGSTSNSECREPKPGHPNQSLA